MFTISVETQFSASHQLILSAGYKEPLHSHKWLVMADVSCERLNKMGLVIDFNRLKAMMKEIINPLNNTTLDENDYFQQNRSSAENVAKYIYEKLEPKLPTGLKLEAVTVTEEPDSRAKYSK